MEQTTDPVFKAISDPTRRKIIEILSHSGQTVKQLTASFNISQPAISQHLRELRASRLVEFERIGVERHYSLNAAPLADVFHWVARYRLLFDPAGHAWALTPGQNRTPTTKVKKGKTSHGN